MGNRILGARIALQEKTKMARLIRAMFRVLHISKSYDGSSTVELGPVKADGNPEHEAFWEASPGGKASITYRPGYPVPFEVGAYYHVDFVPGPVDERPPAERWRVNEVRRLAPYNASARANGSIELTRESRSWPFADDDPHAWSASIRVDVVRAEVIDLFGPAGGPVAVTFSFAGPNDHGTK